MSTSPVLRGNNDDTTETQPSDREAKGYETVMKVIYKGRLRIGSWGEDDEALLHESLLEQGPYFKEEPLADEIAVGIDEHGDRLSVRYYIADQEVSIDKLEEDRIKFIYGIGSAEYTQHYSEYTGYLWTDQNLMVGGHDLLEELIGHVTTGLTYLWMEIEYSKDKPRRKPCT